jgi:hypothetical protein
MATPFTLTPQPVRVGAATKQPIFLALDISGYDACDVEAVCQIEGTASGAVLNLITGMQTDTDDGWVTASAFGTISGTGQQVTRVSVSSGLLQFLRWEVASLGGATAVTFFVRGIARDGSAGLSTLPQSALTSLRSDVSFVDMALGSPSNVTDLGGNFTYGDSILPVRALKIAGLRTFWPGGHGALTYKMALWDGPGTSLITSVNVPVNAAGEYTGTFSSPQTLVAGREYRITVYETSGTRQVYFTNPNITALTNGCMSTTDLTAKIFWPGYYRRMSVYLAGDGFPTGADASDLLGIIEPLFA